MYNRGVANPKDGKDSRIDMIALFCKIDEFCCRFEPWIASQQLEMRQRQRALTMYISEMMTILVLLHQAGTVP